MSLVTKGWDPCENPEKLENGNLFKNDLCWRLTPATLLWPVPLFLTNRGSLRGNHLGRFNSFYGLPKEVKGLYLSSVSKPGQRTVAEKKSSSKKQTSVKSSFPLSKNSKSSSFRLLQKFIHNWTTQLWSCNWKQRTKRGIQGSCTVRLCRHWTPETRKGTKFSERQNQRNKKQNGTLCRLTTCEARNEDRNQNKNLERKYRRTGLPRKLRENGRKELKAVEDKNQTKILPVCAKNRTESNARRQKQEKRN